MKERVIQLLQDACALEEKGITSRTNLKELSLDSLSFIDFLVNVENEFGIEFEPEELSINEWKSVRDILRTVEERRDETNIKGNSTV